MIRVLLKRNAVLWTPYPGEKDLRVDGHGIGLYRHDNALKRQIVKMLRDAPKKWDRRKGHIVNDQIFKLAGVSGAWW